LQSLKKLGVPLEEYAKQIKNHEGGLGIWKNDKMKTPRASESRVSEKRPTTWTPPSSLDAPAPKDGYVHRWIRLEILGN
jgi:hypothetical protein